MNAVPRSQRGVAAGTSTMFVLSGSTLSLGLAFLIMSHTMPLNYAESIFLGTVETTKTKDNINESSNNINIRNQNRNDNNNVDHYNSFDHDSQRFSSLLILCFPSFSYSHVHLNNTIMDKSWKRRQ
jgi:hypothetical protein